MQKRVVGLQNKKSPMVVIFCQCYEGKYKYYRMRKTIGHGYYKIHNKFVPILTDGRATVTAGISLFSSQRTESGTGSR